jgi:hypothetical protein
MRNWARGIQVLAVAISLQLMLVRDAEAYLDPGTGSFIFQTIVAMFLGAAFTLKLFWQRVKSMFGGKTQPDAKPSAEPSDDEGDRS